MRRWIVACGLAVVMLLAAAPAAMAETFTVDSTDDAADAAIDGTCDTDGGAPVVCTLRAAIQEANDVTFNPGADLIAFSADFNQQPADTIVLGSALPTIDTEIHIDGGNCPLSATAPGPCVGVGYAAGPPTALALVVAADDVSIEGLAITNALIAINVTNSSAGFSAHNNWIGVGLSEVGSNGVGVFLGPDSGEAVIGGETAAERNVIVANGTGIDIEGADDAQVEGNFIGIFPNGTTPVPNGENIEITGTTDGGDFEATGNTVGGEVIGITAACAGRCNAIAGSLSNGIDLQGDGGNETPAGATTIQGNHVGLNALGGATPATGNATGIRVGDADQVTIGAPGDLFARNHINGGETGISAAEGAEDLVVGSNTIGVNLPTPNAVLNPPSGAGIDIVSPTAAPASVVANTIAMNTGVALNIQGDAAEISSNDIGRSASGVDLTGGDVGLRILDGTGMTVTDNTVANTTAVGPAAVSIEGGADNVLTGNRVANSGSIGIGVAPSITPSTGNLIGGDIGAESNTIDGSAGDAIEVSGDGSDGNLLLRNLGDNGGLFIDLGADGLGNSPASGPNGGVQAPAITSAVAGVVQGTSAPDATVRLFEKASAANGEIEGFLGSAVADGSGTWEITYNPAIGGPFVGATQTDATLGTSELDVEEVESPPDTAAPQTEITKAPKKKVKTKKRRKRVRFEFSASEPGSSFECSIDGAAFSGCSSPLRFKAKRGKHTFRVRAVDAVGNEDPTPASHAFKVKRKRKKR